MPKTLLFINLPMATMILLLYLMTFLLTHLICWPSSLYISEHCLLDNYTSHTYTHTKKLGKCFKKRIRITSLALMNVHSSTMGFLTVSHSALSLWPHGLYSPLISPGQITGVGSLALLQGIFPNHGSNQGLLHLT